MNTVRDMNDPKPTLADEWTQANEDWQSIGYPTTTYTAWLESQVQHWHNCALARYEPDRMVYTDKQLIENLQVTVNALYFENIRLKKLLEGAR